MNFKIAIVACAAALLLGLSTLSVDAQEAKPAPAKKVAKPAVPGVKPIQPAKPAKQAKGKAKSKGIPAKRMINPAEEANKPKANANNTVISGTVSLPDGTPAAGIELSPYWNAYSGERKGSLKATTDEAGKFTISVRKASRPTVLYATDHKGLGGIIFEEAGSHDDVQLTLEKERQCFTLITGMEGDTLPAYTSIMVMPYSDEGKRAPSQVIFCGARGKGVSMSLVPGDYAFYMRAANLAPKMQKVTVKAGEGVQNLGVLKLDQTIIQKHMGKKAPELSTTAVRKLGTEIEAGTMLSLDDYKGKWVILEFWGFW